MFKNIYLKKKVLITGNTGFKGSWLSTWLLKLGANVIGVSKDIPTSPSMFVELGLKNKIKNIKSDVRDLSKISKIILNEKPDFVFHLAAQSIVSTSYSNPIETITSNVLGTTNILEALRVSNHNCVAIIITSDKAYENIEQIWGYKENDRLGGKDIYSGSKSAAEIIIRSYFQSFLKYKNNIKFAIGRAGNVIGGGDWAKNRIVVDCVEAWSKGKSVEIREPNATRPWQHVLEPISGYLNLGAELTKNKKLNGEAFNFGPGSGKSYTVKNVIFELSKYWGKRNKSDFYKIFKNKNFYEAKLLKLNCDKSYFYFNWKTNLDYKHTIKLTSEWYYDFYKRKKNILKKTLDQIEFYENIAKEKNLKWTE